MKKVVNLDSVEAVVFAGVIAFGLPATILISAAMAG